MIQPIVHQDLEQVFVLNNDFTAHRIDSNRTKGWTGVADDTSGDPVPIVRGRFCRQGRTRRRRLLCLLRVSSDKRGAGGHQKALFPATRLRQGLVRNQLGIARGKSQTGLLYRVNARRLSLAGRNQPGGSSSRVSDVHYPADWSE